MWAEASRGCGLLANRRRPDSAGSMVAENQWHGCAALVERDTGTCRTPMVVVRGLSEKNRQMLIETGADDYLEKSVLMPDKGVNLLPKLLEDVLCTRRTATSSSSPAFPSPV